MNVDRRPIVMVLAGGRGSRMGGADKALLPFGSATLLDRVLARMVGQDVRQILLNANGDPGRFARFALPVVADTIPNQPGPLAGVLAGMEWAIAHAPDVEDLITVPTDTPFLPTDLVDRLLQEREAADAELACAASAGRVHPVCGLWPVRLAPVLRNALVTEGHRRVDRWTAQFRLVQVAFSEHPVDPFLNINTPGDLVMAAELVGH